MRSLVEQPGDEDGAYVTGAAGDEDRYSHANPPAWWRVKNLLAI